MNIGVQIKKYREKQNISQEELALKIFVSRQTISNWENNKSYPDINSLIMLSEIFNVSLDDFIKNDIEEMRKIVDKDEIKKFNLLSWAFSLELISLVVSAYPLAKFYDYIGIFIWIILFFITLITGHIIERFKKINNIQTFKEILAFVDGTKLSYEETQQELGKRLYQKILYAILAGVIALIVSLIIIFIIDNI